MDAKDRKRLEGMKMFPIPTYSEAEVNWLIVHLEAEIAEKEHFWKHWQAWESRAESAERRAQEAEERVLRVVRGNLGQICAYCGWETKKGGGSWGDLQQHIRECPKHPLRETEQRAQEAEARNADLESCVKGTLARQQELEARAQEAEARIHELEAEVFRQKEALKNAATIVAIAQAEPREAKYE